ncbi:UNVERIFIED_CONTAM: hypothetical protein Sangu_2186400 [Sesamum angustifolium]|uniref:RAB6-interacting golgin n=1 Tax=Sesamum angustifolium TaxID=2727405 RepID=A0AAW2LHS8_9LAMI
MAANPNNNSGTSFLPEVGPDGLARESPVIAYTEKVIEEEQLQLRKYIEENYSKIRDVERELANLTMEMKLTSGPKKAALELLRKKIEMSTERIHVAKLKEEQAKKAWEAASKAVKDEEAIKEKLCEDLNNLDGNQRLAQASTTQDSSVVPSTPEPASGTVGSIVTEDNARNSPVKGQNQHPSTDGDRSGKKKNSTYIHGKVRGTGAVSKVRAPLAPGWTGAGFDVDGRG